jgi:hypothetical protein
MKMIGKASLSLFVRIITDVLIAANAVTLLTLPWTLREMLSIIEREYKVVEGYSFLLIFLYVCGGLTFILLIFGHLLMRTLEKGLPFDPRNAGYFRWIGVVFFLLSVAFCAKIFMYNTMLTIFCAGIFAVFSLLSMILSEVFRQASMIWEEHQLTI